MRLLGPTRHKRVNELAGFLYLLAAIFLTLSLYSFHPGDPSWNTATAPGPARNLIGRVGSHIADLSFQSLGVAAWLFPFAIAVVAIHWIRSRPLQLPLLRLAGFLLLVCGLCTALMLAPGISVFGGELPAGGMTGVLLSDMLIGALNPTGAMLLTAAVLFSSLYLVSNFSLAMVPVWAGAPRRWWWRQGERWRQWRDERQLRALARRQLKEERARAKAAAKAEKLARRKARSLSTNGVQAPAAAPEPSPAEPVDPTPAAPVDDAPPWREPDGAADQEEIPICVFEESAPGPWPQPTEEVPSSTGSTAPDQILAPDPTPADPPRRPAFYMLPHTGLLNEPSPRGGYDSAELKEIAAKIKAKLEEFNVLGSVTQINPGPVVTTFEFKPEAGIKYSRIVTLNEDLCLGLQAESILIERLPGKPTVGIEVPNSRREVISLRQILESEEFLESPSRLTISLGKDINGRIKVAALDAMPHLLIAGSTGSGKSVMLNSLIMSVLFKATPDEVRMILIDPKRVEMGIYEGIPHLLTPVITDAKQATNALRNAVIEMERRLKLLAAQGVRNIEQYNKKVKQTAAGPQSLFAEEDEGAPGGEDLKPLPYILLVIDELADLMMLERANVEAAVTRLAQMARAVGMHLVLATQRPSVDVITGLIKANFPSRISFRVATRVDSRTVLDVMGAEHLLGKGDMLFLPPGSSRLVRVHGPLVTESEINRVVEHWRNQAQPNYDESYLLPPPSDDDAPGGDLEEAGDQDPLYREAVRVVVEMGKASTSILQRRLRLGYGRAARILDRMHREGIIGPPDGSRPRDVIRPPDWLNEMD